jgi:hypothetical protein
MARCTKAIEGGARVVHIVKNYTSEVMNFKLAADDPAPSAVPNAPPTASSSKPARRSDALLRPAV